jgi:hypothetical protein
MKWYEFFEPHHSPIKKPQAFQPEVVWIKIYRMAQIKRDDDVTNLASRGPLKSMKLALE